MAFLTIFVYNFSKLNIYFCNVVHKYKGWISHSITKADKVTFITVQNRLAVYTRLVKKP